MGCLTYRKCLETAKAKNQYQALTFKVFREVYPYAKGKFQWKGTPALLWYIIRENCEPPYGGFWVRSYVVDIPYWKCLLFRWYAKKWNARQTRITRRNSILKNSSTGILEDVQKTLEDEIRKNLKTVQREAAKQQEIAQRLSPFEHDYIKAQIEVEV